MKYYEKIILVQLICKCLAAFAECFENGWSEFGTNCYKVIPVGDDGINWFDAQKACERLGSNLASIHDQSEQDYIVSLIDPTSFGNNARGPWIGLNRTALHSQIWQWSDGTSVNFYNWNPGEPNDAHGNTTDGEACVNLWISSYTVRWNDIHCLADRYSYNGVFYQMGGYVCKKRKQPRI